MVWAAALLLLAIGGAAADEQYLWKISATSVEEAQAQSAKLSTFVKAANAAANKKQPCDGELRVQFDSWAEYFGKQYANPGLEMEACLKFGLALSKVAQTNLGGGEVTYWTSPSQYADMTFAEFSAKVLMPPRDPDHMGTATTILPFDNNTIAATPSSYDHRTQGRVSAVKNQGSCGSCWAFSGIGVLESAYMIKYGVSDIQFSDQQITSCLTGSSGYWSQGCNGGWSDEVLDYSAAQLIMLTSDYPYTSSGGSTGSCKTSLVSSTDAGRKVSLTSTSVKVTPYSYSALKAAVAVAPTTVYFEVNNDFDYYSGGIYTSSTCGRQTNHAMVLVGYDDPAGYWIIKNSWGSNWGDKGFVRVQMIKSDNSHGLCGMYDESYTTTLAFDSTLSGSSTSSPPPSPSPPVPSPKPPQPPKPSSGGGGGGQRQCRNRGSYRRYCWYWQQKMRYCKPSSIYSEWMHYYCARACKCPHLN